MVNLNDVLKAGNEYRVKAGLRPYDEIRDILRMPSIAEYVMVVENKLRDRALGNDYGVTHKQKERILEDSKAGILPELELDKQGRVKYPKKMLAVKKRRGRYGGTWAHVKVAVRVGIEINPEFADAVIDTFINQQLLQRRDEGGEAFKALMEAVHQYLSPNQWDYAQISTKISQAVFYDLPVYQTEMRNIWNTHHATPHRQHLRRDICNSLTQMIEIGFIEEINDLYSAIFKLKRNYRIRT